MSTLNIIRVWKDAEYRNSLSAAELAHLPANPVGLIELDDADLESVAGAGSYSCTKSRGTGCKCSCDFTMGL